mmetsp:Transcript_17124/g.37386  ORF Transcript_17124/g.37386 Transcript_17124/m.37386 type:complete len:270 (+) Transcript_17124:67-876(+)
MKFFVASQGSHLRHLHLHLAPLHPRRRLLPLHPQVFHCPLGRHLPRPRSPLGRLLLAFLGLELMFQVPPPPLPHRPLTRRHHLVDYLRRPHLLHSLLHPHLDRLRYHRRRFLAPHPRHCRRHHHRHFHPPLPPRLRRHLYLRPPALLRLPRPHPRLPRHRRPRQGHHSHRRLPQVHRCFHPVPRQRHRRRLQSLHRQPWLLQSHRRSQHHLHRGYHHRSLRQIHHRGCDRRQIRRLQYSQSRTYSIFFWLWFLPCQSVLCCRDQKILQK